MRSKELKNIVSNNHIKCKNKQTDKGFLGKFLELNLFGNLPNSFKIPDLNYGDIKTTHFKSVKSKFFNAKERLTLTNFGNPTNIENINYMRDKNTILETKYFDKIKKGVVFIFKNEDKCQNIDNKIVLGIICYNLEELFKTHPDIKETFDTDFYSIKTTILENNVSQKGQKYLHIHKHGSKNGISRAFGFTNKFLTKIVSIYLNLELKSMNNTDFIDFKMNE